MFADELKAFLFSFACFYIGLSVFLLIKGESFEFQGAIFALLVSCFYLFYCLLEYLFRRLVDNAASSIFSVLPAIVLFFVLKELNLWPYAEIAVICAALLRLLVVFMPFKEMVIQYGILVLDVIAICLFFICGCFKGGKIADKLLFVFLVILTFSTVQSVVFEKRKSSFPFYYFVVMAILVAIIPMKSDPIDWTKVVDAGQRVINSIITMANNASYVFSSAFSEDSYYTGYNSLNVKGGKITGSAKQQIIIRTSDKPYVNFVDEETNVRMKMRRTIYLAGGRGSDIENLISFVSLLHENGVDKEYAFLFSKTAKLEVEYVYLDTCDEIAPMASFKLLSNGSVLTDGVSSKRHKKGYSLSASYIDIDYGSPYLIEMMKNAKGSGSDITMSYEEACEYVDMLYGIELQDLISKEDYETKISKRDSSFDQYLDTTGVGEELKSLTSTVTEGIQNDYDKCKVIEGYLRQYKYNTSVSGASGGDLDMSSAAGLSDIADRFLFENKEGYCVHYTSAMVMMLRLSGIPARVCFGYRYVYPFEQQESYVVDGSCAHTWPEAYIENVGWVPFEPTSTFMTAADYSWHAKAKEDKVAANKVAIAQVPEIPPLIDVEKSEIDEEPSDNTTIKVLYLAALVVISIILLVVILIAGTFFIRKLRYKRAGKAMKVRMDVDMIKKALLKGNKGDFIDRGLLSDYVLLASPELKDDVSSVFDIYYGILYGGAVDQDITDRDSELSMDVRQRVRKSVKRRGKG